MGEETWEYIEPDRDNWDILRPGTLVAHFYGRDEIDPDEEADFWDLVSYLHDRA